MTLFVEVLCSKLGLLAIDSLFLEGFAAHYPEIDSFLRKGENSIRISTFSLEKAYGANKRIYVCALY